MHEGERDPDTTAGGDPPGRTAVVYGGALIGGLLVFLSGVVLVGTLAGLVGGLLFALVVVAQGRRLTGGPRPRRPGPPSP